MEHKTTDYKARAEKFVTAIKKLPQKEKELIVEKMLEDLKLREELVDYITYLQRKKEKSIPYSVAQKHLRKSGKL